MIQIGSYVKIKEEKKAFYTQYIQDKIGIVLSMFNGGETMKIRWIDTDYKLEDMKEGHNCLFYTYNFEEITEEKRLEIEAAISCRESEIILKLTNNQLYKINNDGMKNFLVCGLERVRKIAKIIDPTIHELSPEIIALLIERHVYHDC